MHKLSKPLAMAAGALFALAGAASASTITVDFDNAQSGGGSGTTYTENGFTFTSNMSGGVSFSNSCGTTCLQLSNTETVTVTYIGGLFSVDSFDFSSPGNQGDLTITSNLGPTQTISESLGGNALQNIGFPNDYNDILFFSWSQATTGSGRVDNVHFSVPAPIPLPAAGWMLLAGVGGLAAMARRRKPAA